jgi:hypothetical protein
MLQASAETSERRIAVGSHEHGKPEKQQGASSVSATTHGESVGDPPDPPAAPALPPPPPATLELPLVPELPPVSEFPPVPPASAPADESELDRSLLPQATSIAAPRSGNDHAGSAVNRRIGRIPGSWKFRKAACDRNIAVSAS